MALPVPNLDDRRFQDLVDDDVGMNRRGRSADRGRLEPAHVRR